MERSQPTTVRKYSGSFHLELWSGKALGEGRERLLGFEPGQRGAKAHVDAVGEGDVVVG
jgi:hypothetical protein